MFCDSATRNRWNSVRHQNVFLYELYRSANFCRCIEHFLGDQKTRNSRHCHRTLAMSYMNVSLFFIYETVMYPLANGISRNYT